MIQASTALRVNSPLSQALVEHIRTTAISAPGYQALRVNSPLSQALVEHVRTTAISAPGYQEFCSHQQEIQQRAAAWSRAAKSCIT